MELFSHSFHHLKTQGPHSLTQTWLRRQSPKQQIKQALVVPYFTHEECKTFSCKLLDVGLLVTSKKWAIQSTMKKLTKL